MTSQRKRLTREGLERVVRELVGMDPTPQELEGLLGRLESLRKELDALERLTEPGWEPLPNVTLEGEDAL